VRIVFVINSIGSGGAERVLAQVLERAPHCDPPSDLHLVVLDELPRMRTIPQFVAIHQLDARGRLLASALQLRRLLRQLQPDLVVSFLIRANLASIMARFGDRWPVVLCERMHMGSHLRLRYVGWKLFMARLFPRRLYNLADRVLAVSNGVRDNLVDEFQVDPGRCITVPNPYDRPGIVAQGAELPRQPLPTSYVVAVGRLVEAKNFALTIRAFAQAKPADMLLILGEGPDLERLQSVAAAEGVHDRVRFLGYSQNPFAIVSRAKFLVAASRNEGFPNAIAEAMVLGVPVIATDCPSGPAELLEGGQHGLLIPMDDLDAMVSAMNRLREDGERTRFAASGQLRMDDFSSERVCERYWSIFLELASDIPARPRYISAYRSTIRSSE
jgi:glycosyltransferase involved in cell wall biosynthesis